MPFTERYRAFYFHLLILCACCILKTSSREFTHIYRRFSSSSSSFLYILKLAFEMRFIRIDWFRYLAEAFVCINILWLNREAKKETKKNIPKNIVTCEMKNIIKSNKLFRIYHGGFNICLVFLFLFCSNIYLISLLCVVLLKVDLSNYFYSYRLYLNILHL